LAKLNCPAGKKSGCIDVPDEVFQAPRESIRAYIDTAFCCEGDATFTASTRLYKLSFASNSEIYAKKLQLLLKKFGIASGIIHISKSHIKNHHDQYRLNITGYDLRLFQGHIGLAIERKAAVLRGQLMTREKQDGIPLQISFLQKKKVAAVTDADLRSRGIYLDKTQSLSRATAKELISVLDADEFNPYLNFRYEKILSIETKNETARVYDFTVGGTHTFFANGICSSNCHMLTGAAFNALLKTLEEPPKHAVIILATTEYEKLPATITSRAQRFLFKKLSKAVIMGKLAMEAKAEKIKIDEDALELVAASAEGSVRDAESLLDQISSLTTKITLADVERITGRTGLKKIAEFADLMIKKDLSAAVAHVNALQDEGGNPVQFTKDLIHYLRKVLSLKLSPDLEKTFEKELTKDEIATAKRLGTAADAKLLVQLIKSLIRAYSEMRYSPFAIVPLEIALTENLS
jgi:DNA polymerase III gamma/tau subunit